MLWLLLFLLLAALGVLWWRFAMPARAGAALVPPPLDGNHPSLRTRHYRLTDFHPASPAGPPVAAPSAEEDAEPQSPAPSAPLPPQTAAEAEAHQAPATTEAGEGPLEAGRLPEGALHNYLSAPAPTATDEHNRGVELTAAERRARMRALMNEALENRRAVPIPA